MKRDTDTSHYKWCCLHKIFQDLIHWAKAWNQRITGAWEKSYPQTLHLSTSASALKSLENQCPDLGDWGGLKESWACTWACGSVAGEVQGAEGWLQAPSSAFLGQAGDLQHSQEGKYPPAPPLAVTSVPMASTVNAYMDTKCSGNI